MSHALSQKLSQKTYWLIVIGFLVVLSFVITSKASATEKLTQEQKAEYYQQYQDILDEVNAEYPDANISLEPLNTFTDADFISVDKFKGLAVDRANMEIVVNEKSQISPRATGQGTQSVSLKSNGASGEVSITAYFTLSYNATAQRMVFGSLDRVTSKATTYGGSWSQGSITSQRLDSSRSWGISVGGTYTFNKMSTQHNLYVEFSCGPTGTVS